jgi:hypothetical protein
MAGQHALLMEGRAGFRIIASQPVAQMCALQGQSAEVYWQELLS